MPTEDFTTVYARTSPYGWSISYNDISLEYRTFSIYVFNPPPAVHRSPQTQIQNGSVHDPHNVESDR